MQGQWNPQGMYGGGGMPGGGDYYQGYGAGGGAGGGGMPSNQITNKDNAVYIGNIPYHAQPQDILSLFSQLGEVVAFRAPTDYETQRLRGFAFCQYMNPECVQSAIQQYHGVDFQGRSLRVDRVYKQLFCPRNLSESET